MAVLLYAGAVQRELPHLPERLADLEPPRPTVILDRAGRILSQSGRAEPVPLKQVSPLFIEALLATEDDGFFDHHGISKPSLLRVAVDHLRGARAGGGSTLTQQLAKNLFFSFEKKVDRKLREMLLAAQMEQRYSKEEILQAYCSTVDFGSGCLGVEAAAREYFGKAASALDLLEAATLVGVLNAPTRYHPRANPERCRERRNWVLERLVRTGRVDVERVAPLLERPVSVLPATRFETGHLRDWVMAQLEDLVRGRGLDPAAIPYAGLTVATSIDARLQQHAQREVTARCAELEQRLGAAATGLEGAVVALDPANGEVLALVGGRDYAASAFNCALSRNRQPGSAFKPLLYYTALRQGWSPLDIVVDSVASHAVGVSSWRPQNWDGRQSGPLSLVYSMMRSLNVVAAKVVMQLGAEALVSTARSCGVSAPLDPVPSLSLGAAPVPPLELAGAYATFVNRGVHSRPFVIRRIEDAFGREILAGRPRQEQALDPVEAYLTIDMLKGAVRYGTGQGLLDARYPGELGGKTGTTNDYRDSWFCAVTPNLVVVCWVGNLDNTPMRFSRVSGVTGAVGALPLFKGLLPEIERLCFDGSAFRVPEGVEFRRVDLVTGMESPAGAPLALRMIDY
jgi:membrane peptidoglycan carboxypeptidase